MQSREVTARGRAIGAELRSWRERANLSAADIARKLTWSQSKVSNMERGERPASEVDAAMYLAFCRTPGQDIKEVLAFFHAQEGSWLQLHGDQMSDQLRSVVALETTAAAIWDLQLAVIPGLLQMEEYPGADHRERSGSGQVDRAQSACAQGPAGAAASLRATALRVLHS